MYRFILEPYNGRASRYLCPNCADRRHTFSRYINTETNAHLADHVGRCSRADNCGYHYKPHEYFAATSGALLRQAQDDRPFYSLQVEKPFDTLPRWYVDDTTKAYHHNNFVRFLSRQFGANIALQLAVRYHIGTSKHWPGSTIFWQIDSNDKLRTGKIMLYNGTDGHRVKQPYNHIAWVHASVGSSRLAVSREQLAASSKQFAEITANCARPTANFQLRQCFFGEHLLLTDPFKPVAIVESEKTAIIASFFNPKYIWLAAGSLDGLSRNKCKVLKDRRVILYPDVNGYDKWKLKAREMNLRLPAARFTVDDTLERVATADERVRGIDIADLWIEQLTDKL